jgi:hypothetical protein
VRRQHKRKRELEKHSSECLLYPLHAWRICLGLALLFTVLSAGFARLLPQLLAEPPSDPRMQALFLFMWIPIVVLLVGLPCGFLESVLASAVAGEVGSITWSKDLLRAVLRSGVKWLGCFLAGPSLFAAVGCLYWLQCGEPGVLDCLILAELGLVGVAYWIFALLAVTDGGRLRDLNPVVVADLAHRMGWQGLAVVLAASALLFAHVLVLLVAVAEIHTKSPRGWLLLAAGWMSGMFWSTAFCRLLGIWCYRSRNRLVASDAPSEGG